MDNEQELKTAAILRAAREYVAKGWIQGSWQDVPEPSIPREDWYKPGNCKACAEGAIALACGIRNIPCSKDYDTNKDFIAALRAFAYGIGFPGGFAEHEDIVSVAHNINAWNDRSMRSKEAVLNAFDVAIAWEENTIVPLVGSKEAEGVEEVA